MTDEARESQAAKKPSALAEQIDAKAKRMVKARRRRSPGVWFGLGMMGLIGWSVTVPTLMGAMIGIWLDKNFPGGRSWTLALLVSGLAVGCLNAWHWVAKEETVMQNEEENAMNETQLLLVSAISGVLIGTMFFGGLWWTVRSARVSRHATLWFTGGLLVRISIALTGFYFIGGDHWPRLLHLPCVCLWRFRCSALKNGVYEPT